VVAVAADVLGVVKVVNAVNVAIFVVDIAFVGYC